jgi:hypothetical protein
MSTTHEIYDIGRCEMKVARWIIVVTVLVVPLLTYACRPGETPTPTPDVQASVEAEMAKIATETAIAQALAELSTEQAAVAATQTAMAVSPTSPPASPIPTPSPTTPASVASGVSCPFYVYEAWGSENNHYVPKGWMGDFDDIEFDDNYKLDPDPSRPSVLRINYTPRGANQWAGLYWWDPPQAEWGNTDGGFDLSCATRLTFWARGETGGEKAEFKVGGLKGDYQDSLQPALSTGPIILTGEWTSYALDLSGRDLSHIIGGFVWVTNKASNPDGATIYLDDIRFE